jgi:hypothetical protein
VLALCLLPQPIQFDQLNARTEIQMEYRVSACFRSEVYHFRFTSGRGRSTQVEIKFPDQPERKLGILGLDSDDLLGLTELLKFYRSGPPRGSTTKCHIILTKFVNRAEVACEEYRDESSFDLYPLFKGDPSLEEIGEKKLGMYPGLDKIVFPMHLAERVGR